MSTRDTDPERTISGPKGMRPFEWFVLTALASAGAHAAITTYLFRKCFPGPACFGLGVLPDAETWILMIRVLMFPRREITNGFLAVAPVSILWGVVLGVIACAIGAAIEARARDR